jgi:hypothetical protein
MTVSKNGSSCMDGASEHRQLVRRDPASPSGEFVHERRSLRIAQAAPAGNLAQRAVAAEAKAALAIDDADLDAGRADGLAGQGVQMDRDARGSKLRRPARIAN